MIFQRKLLHLNTLWLVANCHPLSLHFTDSSGRNVHNAPDVHCLLVCNTNVWVTFYYNCPKWPNWDCHNTYFNYTSFFYGSCRASLMLKFSERGNNSQIILHLIYLMVWYGKWDFYVKLVWIMVLSCFSYCLCVLRTRFSLVSWFLTSSISLNAREWFMEFNLT